MRIQHPARTWRTSKIVSAHLNKENCVLIPCNCIWEDWRTQDAQITTSRMIPQNHFYIIHHLHIWAYILIIYDTILIILNMYANI